MKLLICGDAGSLHTWRWATLAAEAGAEVCVFSLNGFVLREWEAYPQIKIYTEATDPALMRSDTSASKWRYLLSVKQVKKIIRTFRPDVVHAHYATSYGLIAMLSGFRNFAVSVWGSDVFDFPKRSKVHEFLLRRILSEAKAIQSTGEVMADEVRKYTQTPVEVIPFGLDLTHYRPSEKDPGTLSAAPRIGSVKSIEKIYGTDILIEAFARVHRRVPDATLHITGDGSLRAACEKQVRESGLEHHVHFYGRVAPDQVPDHLRRLDIFCNLSRRESFGMSVLEASACGIPVVATRVDGVVETARHNVNALSIEKEDAQAAADALLQLIGDPALYRRLREGGLQLVHDRFDREKIRDRIPYFYRKVTGT